MAAHSAALISTEELARRMGAPALRLFDCTTYLRPRPEGGYNVESGRANYDKGHIPGAAFLDHLADALGLNAEVEPVVEKAQSIATQLKDHPGLGAYKGVDEPRNPFRGANWIRPEGLTRALRRLKALDPDHPLHL